MSKPNLINYTEWMAEVERLKAEQPAAKGLTAYELSQAFNRDIKYIREKVLRPMALAGTLIVHKRRATMIDGRTCLVPEYELRKVANGKKAS